VVTTAIFIVRSTDALVEVPRLTDLLAKTEPNEVVCDVSRLSAGLDAVETIARLRLAAGRANATMRVSRAAEPVTDLLVAVGLDDVLAMGNDAA